jgi:hypothetical protein
MLRAEGLEMPYRFEKLSAHERANLAVALAQEKDPASVLKD